MNYQLKASNSKSIETGRVEKGSNSDQKIKQLMQNLVLTHFTPSNIKCYLYLINTTEDINVKRYCTNCGKLGKTDNSARLVVIKHKNKKKLT
jgi:hypothetical protein